jgi:hypothetical protein
MIEKHAPGLPNGVIERKYSGKIESHGRCDGTYYWVPWNIALAASLYPLRIDLVDLFFGLWSL